MKLNMRNYFKQKVHYLGEHVFVLSLCDSFEDDSLNDLWDKYWSKINTKNKCYIHEYFLNHKSRTRNEKSLLRMMVLIEFCEKHNIKMTYTRGL